MSWPWNWYYLKAWGRNLFGIMAVSAVLSAFGALWLSVEMATFFFQDTRVPDFIRSCWFIFAMLGIAIAIWLCKPQLAVSCKLSGRDVTIEIAIGDLFLFPGAIIIGTNTTFDTRISRDLISEKSIQGLFTRKYYGEETQMNVEIAAGLNALQCETLTGRRIGKANKYALGTIVRLNPRERTAYMVAIADLNEHGVASGNFEGLKESLAKLWVFIGRRGLKEPLVMPVLGTGFSRLPQPREEVVREIIKSFVAACSEISFCDKLTIVLSPHDVAEHRMMIQELGSYLKHVCTYTSFGIRNGLPVVGTPVQ